MFGGTENSAGRFPANLLVSDDVLNDGKITKSAGGLVTAGAGFNAVKGFGVNTTKGGEATKPETMTPQDSGSYSRYFDLDKWWAERVAELPASVQSTFPFLIVPKAAKSEKGGDNSHPTVKPLKLMSYLITLGSRKGDIVLDPFLGSGTTAVAAKMSDRQYIGVERETDYVAIATARIDKARPAPLTLL